MSKDFSRRSTVNDVCHTMDGLIIDEDMRVLDEANEPIPGLFAAGDVSSCFLGATYLGVAAGIASGRSITFGRHAGRVAAQS
ncbi:FAD-binding protein [Adlercreutzia sp. R21]|uniref:FAD-binding protein n=1 Tax=Adlercreutzia wanghongyangiae TaxID=3111451 RepID=A0ABU6II52_9ACTN|nr:FAD-binding protein [Adlercreutzia sp. R21]MEC4176142.1 FAD-binding protein [Adlercreutzia sp. R7]MEC4183994.1 FAD-binding protein [Adlercreutzia sp. R21]